MPMQVCFDTKPVFGKMTEVRQSSIFTGTYVFSAASRLDWKGSTAFFLDKPQPAQLVLKQKTPCLSKGASEFLAPMLIQKASGEELHLKYLISGLIKAKSRNREKSGLYFKYLLEG